METYYTADIRLENVEGLVEFVRDFDTFLSLHRELEANQPDSVAAHLFKVGSQVRQGYRGWTRADVNDIIRWKKLQPLRRRIEEGSADLEKRMRVALSQADEEDRVNELCRIPGFGPVLASAVLALTFPDTYGVLDNASWHALGLLGFDLPPKPYSGGGYTVSEALQYQSVIRALAGLTGGSSFEVAETLHAFYKTANNRNRRGRHS